MASAGLVVFWIYLLLAFFFAMGEGDLLRGNIVYPVGFHRWVTALYVLVCAAWIEAALHHFFSGQAVVSTHSHAERKRVLLVTLAIAMGFGWFVATEDRWAPWAFLACGLYWLVRYAQRRRGRAVSGWWGRPYGTGLGVQLPAAAAIIAFGYWMFVLVTYHLVGLTDDWLGDGRRVYRGVLEGRGDAGGLLDLGTCPSVIFRIERGGRSERHEICSHRIRVSPKLSGGQPVLIRGRHGVFGFAVDQVELAPPAAGPAG